VVRPLFKFGLNLFIVRGRTLASKAGLVTAQQRRAR